MQRQAQILEFWTSSQEIRLSKRKVISVGARYYLQMHLLNMPLREDHANWKYKQWIKETIFMKQN